MAAVPPVPISKADPKPMPKSNSFQRVAATVAAGLLLVGLAGCGRKGDPSLASTTPAQPQAVSPIGIPVGVATPEVEPPKPTGKFILDPLL
jgi:predicted small lipoprotein YifL